MICYDISERAATFICTIETTEHTWKQRTCCLAEQKIRHSIILGEVDISCWFKKKKLCNVSHIGKYIEWVFSYAGRHIRNFNHQKGKCFTPVIIHFHRNEMWTRSKRSEDNFFKCSPLFHHKGENSIDENRESQFRNNEMHWAFETENN